MSIERRRMSRARILQGAVDILDMGVYSDLTVDALARALHMSKSTLYKYFASKDDVVVSLLDEACNATEDELDDIDVEAGAPAEVVARIVGVLASHADRVPRAAVLQGTRLPASSQDRLQLTRAGIGQALQRAIARGATSRTFAWDDAVLAATTFMAGADAAMKAAARGEVSGTRGEAVQALHDLYRSGLLQGSRAA